MIRLLYLKIAMTAALMSCHGTGPTTPETERLERATAIALSSIQPEQVGEYRVVSAVERVIDGAYMWRITLKRLDLLPEDPSQQLVGLGGELFVDVDLASGNSETRLGD